MHDRAPLKTYYETHEEDARLTSRPGQIEFITTMHCIEQYLSPSCRVLEIGAGTGRYSLSIAQKGYQVDAVELFDHNIQIFKSKITPELPLHIHQGDALNLCMFPDETFDITLLLGPMYHLYTQKDQQKALREAVRVTRKGGIVMAAYCMSDAAILQHGFIRGNTKSLIENGLLEPVSFRTHSRPQDIIALHRPSDIALLRKGLPVTHLRLVATDGFAHFIKDTLDAMDEESFAFYLKYHFATCERSDLMGISNHTLDIMQRI